MKGYIYKIINKENNKFYIGSTANIERRFTAHRVSLNKNKHKNYHLQSSWNKYGERNFEFKIVEEFVKISRKKLYEEEQKYLDTLCKEHTYNLTYCAYGGGADVRAKPCYILDLAGNTIKDFDSRNEAALYLGLESSSNLVRSSNYPQTRVKSKIDGNRYRVVNKDYYEENKEDVLNYPEFTKKELHRKYVAEIKEDNYPKKYEYKGDKLTVSEIAKKEKVTGSAIEYRIKKSGTWKKSTAKKYEYKGETLTILDIAKKEGVCMSAIYSRFRLNGTGELKKK